MEFETTAENPEAIIPERGDWQVLSDSAPGGLMKVRQLATIADRVNRNMRVYPLHVVRAAVTDARKRAKAGAMLGEYVHPKTARTDDGREEFIDNPDRKATRIVDIHYPDKNGRVYADFLILDTPLGHKLKAGFDALEPVGVSTRFKMSGEEHSRDGVTVEVADSMYISTFDHVDDPAFLQTKADFRLLTDSEKQDFGVKSATADSEPGAQSNKQETCAVNEKLKRTLNRVNALIAQRAGRDEVLAARRLLTDAVSEAELAGDDLSDITAKVVKLDESIAGYKGGSLEMIAGNELGSGESHTVNEVVDTDLESTMAAAGNKGASVADKAAKPEEKPDPRSAFLDAMIAREQAKADDAARQAAIDSAVAENDEAFKALTDEQQKFVIGNVQRIARTPEEVKSVLAAQIDSVAAMVAKERLHNGGYKSNGQTTEDVGSTGSTVKVRQGIPAYMEDVDKLLLAADDSRKRQGFDPGSVKRTREYNRSVIDGWAAELARKQTGTNSVEEWMTKTDTVDGKNFGPALDSQLFKNTAARFDSATLSTLYNQPKISTALMYLAFQDLTALYYVDGIGPGAGDGNGGWFDMQGIGSVLRIPVEYYDYSANSGYAGAASRQYDPGLLTPENTGIDEGNIKTMWLPFAPTWRRIAASATRDAIKAIGNGPLNFPLVARLLDNIARHKSRVIDKALYDEMCYVSDEYQATAKASFSPNLTNNSVYLAAGSCVVNLNPAKLANAAVVSTTDQSVTYGSTVCGALRLPAASAGTASPYFGDANGYTPIVRPRTVVDLNAAGVITNTVRNAVAVTAPAAQVIGYLDDNNDIASYQGIPNATCAFDYRYGILVFATGQVSNGGSGTLITTAVTCAYSYATNFDNFVLNNPTLATGQALESYMNGYFRQLDRTVAAMGSAPRYSEPNLMLGSLNSAANVQFASIFYKFNSPTGTTLFPTEQFYGERNNLMMAKHNSPWFFGDDRNLLTKKGATKYALDTPAEVRGPFPKYDSGGKMIDADQYYLTENSVIATPVVTAQNGTTTYNPPSRTIIWR